MLWAAISAIQRKEPDIVSVVYSGDTDTTKEKIIEKVKVRSSFTGVVGKCDLFLPGAVRYRAVTKIPPLCLPTVATSG